MNPQALLAEFLTAKRATGLNPRSIAWYQDQIMAYLGWLATRHDAGDFCDPARVDAFLAHERARNLANSTIRARHRGLSIWFAWLVRRKYLRKKHNPMRKVDRPSVAEKKIRYVTLETFTRLRRSIAGETWLDDRDRAILSLMMFSGLRVSEVVGLAPADVDVARRLVSVRDGKGGKDRDVPCAEDFATAHVRYLMRRPAYAGPELFVGHDGHAGVRGPLTDNGIRQMLRRRCARAGLDYYSPHAFRHGFAMLFLNAGMNLSAVSEAMGHKSEQTTKIYARWLTEGLVKAYDETMRRFQLPDAD